MNTHEDLASTAVVRQSHTLLYRSLAVHEPTVVFVRRGRKKLRWAGRELVVEAGGAAALITLSFFPTKFRANHCRTSR